MSYIVADAECSFWGHVFDDIDLGPSEKLCRIVYDIEAGELLNAEVWFNNDWKSLTGYEFCDLADSITAADPHIVEGCKDYGLRESDDIPDWVQAPTATPAP